MNLTKEEQEKLLAEAKERYPVETEFISFSGNIFYVIGNPFFNMWDAIEVSVNDGGFASIRDSSGQWAEIIPQEPLIGGELNAEEMDIINNSADAIEIPSAEDFIKANWAKFSHRELFIEFAKLHTQKALQEASEKANIIISVGGNDEVFHKVNKVSILSSYPLSNIK